MEVIPGTSQYRFQSSLRTSSYLSFEAGPDAELIKLVLRQVPKDVVDENSKMRLLTC